MSQLDRQQEKKLILACKKGDALAMTNIYESFCEELLRSAYLMLKNHDDAQDMVSQTFILFFKSIERFNTAYPIRPWLHRILKNEISSFFQKKNKMYSSEEDMKANVTAFEPNQEEAVFTAEELNYLKEAMSQLKDEERRVLEGYYFQEMSVRDLALMMDIPEGTIKSRLFNARASLAQKIKLLMKK